MTFLGLTASQASASYTASVQGTTLEVKGDKASDKLAIVPNGAAALALDVGADGTIDFQFDRSTFDKVHVDAGDGDDEITVIGNVADEAFTFEGGAGDDRLLGGNGADVFNAGPGNDFVDGNQGADTALLGSGNDTFQWDPGDGNDTVEGQTGTDVMQFNGSNIGEQFNVSAERHPRALHPQRRRHRHGPRHARAHQRARARRRGHPDRRRPGRYGPQLVDVDESGFDGNGDAEKDNVIVNGTANADKITACSPPRAPR